VAYLGTEASQFIFGGFPCLALGAQLCFRVIALCIRRNALVVLRNELVIRRKELVVRRNELAFRNVQLSVGNSQTALCFLKLALLLGFSSLAWHI
jgi:hypothetical protein